MIHHYLSIRVRIKSIFANRIEFLSSAKCRPLGIFVPGRRAINFFSSESSETGFSSSGRAQNGFFSRHSRLLAFLRLSKFQVCFSSYRATNYTRLALVAVVSALERLGVLNLTVISYREITYENKIFVILI